MSMLFTMLLVRVAPVLLLVLVIVFWVRSGRSDAHARFKRDQADRPDMGRLGE